MCVVVIYYIVFHKPIVVLWISIYQYAKFLNSVCLKYKNEVGCRDDTVPKTVDTRRHCKED